jgi:hypothetical protein
VAIAEVIAVVLAGLGFAAYFGLTDRASDVAAGAAFGLAAAIGIGGLFTTHDQWELSRRLYRLWELASSREGRERQFEELRSVNGFFLGYELACASSNTAPDLSGIEYVRSFCAELNLTIAVDEWDRLSKTPSTMEEVKEVVDMVRSRVEQYAPPQWWCFFLLGSTVEWMTEDLEAKRSLTRVRAQLAQIGADPALSMDQRYVRAVDSLLAVLPATLASARADWPTITERVNEVLTSLPEPELSLRIAPFAVPLSDWFWITTDGGPGAMRFIGEGSLVASRGGRFELSRASDRVDCVVRFENSEWSCDVHKDADSEHPCHDIEMVSDLTDGGRPVTEARLLLVRDG